MQDKCRVLAGGAHCPFLILCLVGYIGNAAGEQLQTHPGSIARGQHRRSFKERLRATSLALATAQSNLNDLEWISNELEDPDNEALVSQPAYSPSDGVRIGRAESTTLAPTYNKENMIPMEGLGWTYETCLAVLFVCVIAGGPVAVSQMHAERKTRMVIIECTLTVLVLVAGFYLFTNIIMFHSTHFQGTRCLTIVESVYFMAQIITTVGYGDIVPAYPRGQVVVGFYVLVSLFLIVGVVSKISQAVINRVEMYSNELTQEAVQQVAAGAGATDQGRKSCFFKKPEVSYVNTIASGASLFMFVLGGILFYHYYPGEEKTWLQAIYMSVVTLSTTGFGAFTAATTAGQVFGAFWMVFGVAALVSFVGAFAETVMKLKEVERHSCSSMKNQMDMNLQKAHTKGTGRMNQTEFLRFAVLQLHIASEEQLEIIESEFQELSPDRQGHVHSSVIQQRLQDMATGTGGTSTPRTGGTPTPGSARGHSASDAGFGV